MPGVVFNHVSEGLFEMFLFTHRRDATRKEGLDLFRRIFAAVGILTYEKSYDTVHGPF